MKHLATNSLTIHKIQAMTLIILITILVIVIHPIDGALSAQCVSENLALQNNTDFLAAAPKLGCHIELGVSESCSVDFRTASGEVATICRDLGYQFIEKDFIADCSVKIDGKKFNADYYILNFPYCIGPSCNSTELEEELQTVEYPKFETQLEAGGFSNCEISAAVPPSHTILMTIVIATASVFSLSMMLL